MLRLLKRRSDCLTVFAVALEELVHEGLRLGALGAVVHAPAGREHLESAAYFLAGQRHRGGLRLELQLGLGHGEVCGLKQALRHRPSCRPLLDVEDGWARLSGLVRGPRTSDDALAWSEPASTQGQSPTPASGTLIAWASVLLGRRPRHYRRFTRSCTIER